MKTAEKISLTISLAFIVIGGIMVALGIHYGGREMLNNIYSKYEFKWPLSDTIDVDFDKSAEIIKGDLGDSYNASSIKKIDISIGAAKLLVEDSPDDQIHVSTKDMSSSQVINDDSKLVIKCKGASSGKSSVQILIPASASFKEVDIDAGATEFESSGFICENFDLDLGAGEAHIKSLNVSNSADIDISAGDLEIKSGEIANLDIDLGMGNLDYTGIVTGDLDADCGMGNATFNFKDNANNHNYDLEANMGNVNFGNKDYSGFTHKVEDNGADSDYNVSCGMGNIDINFAN